MTNKEKEKKKTFRLHCSPKQQCFDMIKAVKWLLQIPTEDKICLKYFNLTVR